MENSYIITINKYIKNENYVFLENVFKNYDNLDPDKVLSLLKYALKSDLVKDQKASNTANYTSFWKQISIYYDQFDDCEKDEILHLIKNLNSYNKSTAEFLYNIIINSFFTVEEKRDYLSFLTQTNHFYEFIKDNDLRCLWFIQQIKLGAKTYINFSDSLIPQFNFNEQLWKEMILHLTKIDEDNIYKSFNYILENKGLNLIFNCLKKGKLSYQGNNDFPNDFYHLKIIQRIFINIDLEQNLDKRILNKIISNIDTSFKFYGKEMNEFVSKHQKFFSQKFSSDYFVNGFEIIHCGWIHEYPYVSISMLLNQPIETSIETLKNSNDSISLEDFKERSIKGQNKELSILFTEKYSVENKEKIIALLNELIENDVLYHNYLESIVEFFAVSVARTNENIDSLWHLIKKTKISNNFNLHLSKLYQFLFKNGFIDDERVKNRFFNYKVDNLSANSAYGEEKSYIDVQIYINTELGRYFETIRTLDDNILEKSDIKKLVLKQIQDIPDIYKNYIIGQFPVIWGDVDEIEATVDLYQGFSYKYRTGKKELEWFKPIIQNILEVNDFDDEITLFNTMIILFETISPLSISIHNHKYFKKLSLKMLTAYLDYDYNLKYSEEWIQYLFNTEKYSKLVINNLFCRLSKIKSDKLQKILLFLENMPVYDWKLKNYSYCYALCDKFKKEQLQYISKLIVVLLKKQIVNIDYECIECIESILEQMADFKMKTNVNQLLNKIRNYLILEDYIKLNQKFRYLVED